MRILASTFTAIFFLFGLISPSFSENTNIRILEKKSLTEAMLINRLCVGGYEFVVLCKGYKERCAMSKEFNFQLSQTITEEGGGKRC